MDKPKIDPKEYAKRLANAKKIVASAEPEVKKKLREYYPDVTKKSLVTEKLSPSKPKGTQAGHSVTDSANYTRTVK